MARGGRGREVAPRKERIMPDDTPLDVETDSPIDALEPSADDDSLGDANDITQVHGLRNCPPGTV
jgi:hypothetical protein